VDFERINENSVYMAQSINIILSTNLCQRPTYGTGMQSDTKIMNYCTISEQLKEARGETQFHE